MGEKVDIDKKIEEKKAEYSKIEEERNTTKSILDNIRNSPQSTSSPIYIMSKIKERLKENDNWVSIKEKLTGG